MSQTVSAEFETRRDAEMAVEHIVQEHGLDRASVSVISASAQNSAGTKLSGSDLEDGHEKASSTVHPALGGKLKVSVEVEDGSREKVLSSFSNYGGKQIAS